MEEYLTVFDGEKAEYVEKHSRFIANVFHIETVEEANAVIEKMRSKYWDAKHNVYAYALRDGTQKLSDDKEPHGTAGKPVLDVITGNNLYDVMIVVTRYFGGVLLGTGGLVRAYQTSALNAVKSSPFVLMCQSREYSVVCEYSEHKRLLAAIEKYSGEISDTQFSDKIKIFFCVKTDLSTDFENELTEVFSGRITAKTENEKFSAYKFEK